MSKRHIIAGIDIGTHNIKVIVAEKVKGNERYFPRIIGAGKVESRGLRHGYIADKNDARKSITEALKQAEKSSGAEINKVFMSIGGVGLSATTSIGKSAVSRADMEVSETDISSANQASENEIPTSLSLNRKVIHAVPLEYKLDGHPVLGDPVGLKGSSLEVKTLFITCLEHHLNDLIQIMEDIGVDIVDVIASPIASSFVTLSKTQKIAGCILANIGAETTSIVVFENNIPISLEVFPIGGSDITNDIALGLKIPLEEAEQIKLGGITGSSISKKKLDEIISARISDIFDMIISHLKKINKNELLPAGIIITGGGAGFSLIEDMAKENLNLPSSVASLTTIGNENTPIKDSTWSVAYGLCIIGLNEENEDSLGIGKMVKKTKNGFIAWIKQFLP